MRKLLFILCLCCCSLMFSLPAMAVAVEETAPEVWGGYKGFSLGDWNFSMDANVQFNTYYTTNSKEYPTGTGYDDTDLTADVGNETSVRFLGKNDSYRFLLDFRNETGFRSNLQALWARWDFDGGYFFVGRTDPLTWDPMLLPPPLKSDIGQMIGYPTCWHMRLGWDVGEASRVTFAVLAPDNYTSDWLTDLGAQTGHTFADVDTELPAFEIRYDVPIGPVSLGFVGGYTTYDLVDEDNDSYAVDSGMVGVVARYFNGPFSLHGSFFLDRNEYGHGGDPRQKGVNFTALGSGQFFGGPVYDAASDSIKDSDYWGAAVSMNYFFNDKWGIMVGGSGGKVEDDMGNKDQAIGYGFLVPIKLTPNIVMVPFANYTDWLDRDPVDGPSVDEGHTLKAGIQWSFQWNADFFCFGPPKMSDR